MTQTRDMPSQLSQLRPHIGEGFSQVHPKAQQDQPGPAELPMTQKPVATEPLFYVTAFQGGLLHYYSNKAN